MRRPDVENWVRAWAQLYAQRYRGFMGDRHDLEQVRYISGRLRLTDFPRTVFQNRN